jgi:hypothetical protein
MPSVLEAPEVVVEKNVEKIPEVGVAIGAHGPTMGQWLGRLLEWPWVEQQLRGRMTQGAYREALSKRFETPVDIVARDYPYLFIYSFSS